MRITKKQYISNTPVLSYIYEPLHSYLIHYPTPYNISYLWNFGFLSFLFLMIQIITGFFFINALYS